VCIAAHVGLPLNATKEWGKSLTKFQGRDSGFKNEIRGNSLSATTENSFYAIIALLEISFQLEKLLPSKETFKSFTERTFAHDMSDTFFKRTLSFILEPEVYIDPQLSIFVSQGEEWVKAADKRFLISGIPLKFRLELRNTRNETISGSSVSLEFSPSNLLFPLFRHPEGYFETSSIDTNHLKGEMVASFEIKIPFLGYSPIPFFLRGFRVFTLIFRGYNVILRD
jgi:hypothetical protein